MTTLSQQLLIAATAQPIHSVIDVDQGLISQIALSGGDVVVVRLAELCGKETRHDWFALFSQQAVCRFEKCTGRVGDGV